MKHELAFTSVLAVFVQCFHVLVKTPDTCSLLKTLEAFKAPRL